MSKGIHSKALDQLLMALQNLGCSYVVIDKDGADYVHGELLKNANKKPRKYPYGALQNYYLPWIKDLQPGASTEVPAGEFDLKDIQSGVTARASAMWGNGSYITCMKPEKNALEILRLV